MFENKSGLPRVRYGEGLESDLKVWCGVRKVDSEFG
jgi:hypothetical protein